MAANLGRFGVAKVTAGPDNTPMKTIVTGKSGEGKTWFASTITDDQGNPIFILPIEEGLKGACPDAKPVGFRDDHGRWLVPNNLTELYQMLDAFAEANAPVDVPGPDGKTVKRRPYRHLAIDSLSGIEKLVNEAAMGAERAAHMEDKEYRKVWHAAYPYWQAIQNRLDEVRKMGVHLWIIAHSRETFDSAEGTGDVFKKWDLSLRGSGQPLEDLRELWRRWADNVFFIQKDVTVAKGDKNKRSMARVGGRVLITRDTGRVYAKSRLAIPERVAATWPDLQKAMRAKVPVKVDKAREQVSAIAAQLEPEDRASIEADLAAAVTPTQVAAVLSRAQGMLSMLEREEAGDEGDNAGQPAPAGANGAAAGPMSDEDRLAAIDQGRA